MVSINHRRGNLKKNGALVAVKLWVPEKLRRALVHDGKRVPQPIEVTAEVDTGTETTCIPGRFADRLGLSVIGTTTVLLITGEIQKTNVYRLRLLFPQDVSIEVYATQTEFAAEEYYTASQCLIGRDVLKYGMFIYNGQTDTFSLVL